MPHLYLCLVFCHSSLQVLDRVAQPIKQIRKGLKDTGIWPLLSDRPDVHPIIFPREVDEELDAQVSIALVSLERICVYMTQCNLSAIELYDCSAA